MNKYAKWQKKGTLVVGRDDADHVIGTITSSVCNNSVLIVAGFNDLGGPSEDVAFKATDVRKATPMERAMYAMHTMRRCTLVAGADLPTDVRVYEDEQRRMVGTIIPANPYTVEGMLAATNDDAEAPLIGKWFNPQPVGAEAQHRPATPEEMAAYARASAQRGATEPACTPGYTIPAINGEEAHTKPPVLVYTDIHDSIVGRFQRHDGAGIYVEGASLFDDMGNRPDGMWLEMYMRSDYTTRVPTAEERALHFAKHPDNPANQK